MPHLHLVDTPPAVDADDLPLIYVPARLILALAGRCSCEECSLAYAEHRPEPHDPRPIPLPRRHLHAV